MSEFVFGEEARKVQWGRTTHLNFLRAVMAGSVWSVVVLLITGGKTAAGGDPWWAIALIIPAGYLGMAAFLIVCSKLTKSTGWELGQQVVAFGVLAASVMIVVGDPLVYLLHRNRPSWVPVEIFKPMNFTMVLFVLDPAKTGATVK